MLKKMYKVISYVKNIHDERICYKVYRKLYYCINTYEYMKANHKYKDLSTNLEKKDKICTYVVLSAKLIIIKFYNFAAKPIHLLKLTFYFFIRFSYMHSFSSRQ